MKVKKAKKPKPQMTQIIKNQILKRLTNNELIDTLSVENIKTILLSTTRRRWLRKSLIKVAHPENYTNIADDLLFINWYKKFAKTKVEASNIFQQNMKFDAETCIWRSVDLTGAIKTFQIPKAIDTEIQKDIIKKMSHIFPNVLCDLIVQYLPGSIYLYIDELKPIVRV